MKYDSDCWMMIMITFLLQCVISCPVVGLEQEVEEQLHAGVAAVLKENVGSSLVKDICSSIKKERDVLSPIRKATRNPLILVLDKVTTFCFAFIFSHYIFTVTPERRPSETHLGV